MNDRRALPRHKTFIKGRIYFNNRLASMECIVRDVTGQGCRIEFSENVTLPDNFELYLPNKDEYFQARVKWRRGNNIGLTWQVDRQPRPPAEAGETEKTLAERVSKLEQIVAALQKRLDVLQRTSNWKPAA
jgi:hypothetical protein